MEHELKKNELNTSKGFAEANRARVFSRFFGSHSQIKTEPMTPANMRIDTTHNRGTCCRVGLIISTPIAMVNIPPAISKVALIVSERCLDEGYCDLGMTRASEANMAPPPMISYQLGDSSRKRTASVMINGAYKHSSMAILLAGRLFMAFSTMASAMPMPIKPLARTMMSW